MLYVGQEVVCIEDGWNVHNRGTPIKGPHPVKGQIYKIAEIRPPCGWVHPDHINDYLYFSEFGHNGYSCRWFRPVQKKKIEDVLSQEAPKDSEKWDNRRKGKEKV